MDADGATVDDPGGGGGAGPQQFARGDGVGGMRAGRDRGRPQRGPCGRAVCLLRPLTVVLSTALLGGGAERRPVRPEPRAEPVTDPSGHRPDWVGVRPQLATRFVVEAVLDIGRCPARKPPAAQDRAQVAGRDAGQWWAAALKFPRCCQHFLSCPRYGGGCLLARVRGRADSFLTEARRGPTSINSGPERRISHGRARHTEHILRGPVARADGHQTIQDAGTDKRRAARLDDTEQSRVAEQAKVLGNRRTPDTRVVHDTGPRGPGRQRCPVGRSCERPRDGHEVRVRVHAQRGEGRVRLDRANPRRLALGTPRAAGDRVRARTPSR